MAGIDSQTRPNGVCHPKCRYIDLSNTMTSCVPVYINNDFTQLVLLRPLRTGARAFCYGVVTPFPIQLLTNTFHPDVVNIKPFPTIKVYSLINDIRLNCILQQTNKVVLSIPAPTKNICLKAFLLQQKIPPIYPTMV